MGKCRPGKLRFTGGGDPIYPILYGPHLASIPIEKAGRIKIYTGTGSEVLKLLQNFEKI